MGELKKFLFIVLIIFASFDVSAKNVTVAFGEKLPPFIIPETNSGIEVDIVREALAYKGHTLEAVYLPMARIPIIFKSRKVDMAMLDVGEDMSSLGGFYGNPPILYDNVFITLEKKNISIKKPKDLEGLRIVSFIGALKRYPEWLSAVGATEKYVEKNDQSVQPLLLNFDRCDVVLSDRSIFKYYMNLAKKNPRYKYLPIVEHKFTVANPSHYRPVFLDKSIRDDFNLGLKELIKKKRNRTIINSYLRE
jgi:polar amino acid transport system substrate-binding protein